MGHLLGLPASRPLTSSPPPGRRLEWAGCYRVSTETASDACSDRPALEQVLDQLRPGDTLVIWKLDHLGRSLRHLVDTFTGLARRARTLWPRTVRPRAQ